MAPPPELIDDVTAEIFLRLPPDEPEHLFRASLVCKPWFRLLTDPDFLRRYRAFHRTPPLLGYLEKHPVVFHEIPETRFVPTTSASLAPIPSFGRALDCHHGRVLLHAYDNDRAWGGHLSASAQRRPRIPIHDNDWYLVVCDPVTGNRQRMPDPGIDWENYSAAVCCPVSGCDHLECHGGPFRVVFIASNHCTQVKACVYSSETGAWSTPVTLGEGCKIQPRRATIIGDEIYFAIWGADPWVKYDIYQNCLSMINPLSQDEYNSALMEMEDGSLGFVYIRDSNLYLWSRKVNSEGAAEWVQFKAIELGEKIFVAKSGDEAFVVGAAEGVGVIFVRTSAGLFTIKVNSGQVKKIEEPGVSFIILPFMSFYTPDFGKIIARKAKDMLISDVPFN